MRVLSETGESVGETDERKDDRIEWYKLGGRRQMLEGQYGEGGDEKRRLGSHASYDHMTESHDR